MTYSFIQNLKGIGRATQDKMKNITGERLRQIQPGLSLKVFFYNFQRLWKQMKLFFLMMRK